MLDAKNYLRSKRQRSMMYGEVGCLMRYFQQQLSINPSFYHANQMDSEEQITNVFWADARMLIDYEHFGDVVSLDTTYCTNVANRPLAIFSGFNHHRTSVIFGAALLYDETIPSFIWLFETFLEAHKKKKPLTVFTDQDQAMAKALHEVEFEAAWSALLIEYDVHGNSWLQNTYNLKEKWATCYMTAFTLGMRSTKLSESVNSSIKTCMKPNLNISQFFKNFERVLEEKRYCELKCDFEARQKLPRLRLESSPMLQQLSTIYTPTVFNLFQNEFILFAAAYIKQKNETQLLSEFIVGLVGNNRDWIVTYAPKTMMISCTCRRFEMVGLLCCHIVKVYDVLDVKLLPNHYILKRWTREARSGVVQDFRGNEVEEDPKLQSTERYRKLCLMLIRLATEASVHQSTFSLVCETMCDLSKKVMAMSLMENGQENGSNAKVYPTDPSMMPSKGFKKRTSVRGSKRLKSWVELQSKRKKSNHRIKDIRAQSVKVVSSAPPKSQFNFTELLTAPFDQSLYSLEGICQIGDTSNAKFHDQDMWN